MNQKLRYVGLLAILPLVLVALTPDLIADADAARNDANLNDADDQKEFQSVRNNEITNEERDTSVKSLAKGYN